MNPIPLPKARALAERVCELLAPHCELLEIAGSIRRERPEVGDIDLVALPRRGAERALREAFLSAAACAEAVHGCPWCAKHGRGEIVLDGPAAKRVLLRHSRVQCDLWIARHRQEKQMDLFNPGSGLPWIPGNFGALLLTYTGSKEHNIQIVLKAKDKGWRWHPSGGLITPDGEVYSETEEEIFAALGIPVIPPAEREARWGNAPRPAWVDQMLDDPPFSSGNLLAEWPPRMAG